ncbi:MAG: penicillin-binding protein 2 [Acidobacteriota bacterium]
MATSTLRKKSPNSRQVVFTRFMFIVAFFTIWMLGIGVRLVHLQVTQHEWLTARAAIQREDHFKTKLLRGTIFDRDGRMLASSVRAQTLYADATEIDDTEKTAKFLAKVLKMDGAALGKQLAEAKATKKRFIPLVKKIDLDVAQKINKSLETAGLKKGDLPNYDGLHWTEDQVRKYPYETLGAQVIGFSNAEDTGMGGIEQSMDELLHGAVIKKIQERDRIGRVYDETIEVREKPADVVLTIGTNFQFIADEALMNGVKAASAKAGMAVVLSVKTGEILAMSNYPTYDPNSFKTATPESLTNHTIQSTYSPGSTFKLVTYSSALEKNLFRPDDMIDAGNGAIEIGKHRFTDSHHIGSVTYSQALAHSSNVCAIKTGQRVGKDDFWSMLQKMGFGSRTGVELPAETSGIVRSPDKWNGDSLASMSIGYEIGVTALQMATAFATIANDGVKIQPRIIKEIRKPDQQPVASDRPENVRVASVETARNMRTMLRQVVLTGTGRRAQLNGYTSAGKTGTAWKFDPKTKRVEASKYVSSFIGMAPADDPEIVIAVVIDEPQSGARDGGMVAAPVFKAIADQMLPILGVKPDAAPSKDTNVAAVNIPETAGSASDKAEDKKKSDGDGKAQVPARPKNIEPPKGAKEVKKEVKKATVTARKGVGNTVAYAGEKIRSKLETSGVT